nr:unnamed protein product [Spirometra erinaceieuropaei]
MNQLCQHASQTQQSKTLLGHTEWQQQQKTKQQYDPQQTLKRPFTEVPGICQRVLPNSNVAVQTDTEPKRVVSPVNEGCCTPSYSYIVQSGQKAVCSTSPRAPPKTPPQPSCTHIDPSYCRPALPLQGVSFPHVSSSFVSAPIPEPLDGTQTAMPVTTVITEENESEFAEAANRVVLVDDFQPSGPPYCPRIQLVAQTSNESSGSPPAERQRPDQHQCPRELRLGGRHQQHAAPTAPTLTGSPCDECEAAAAAAAVPGGTPVCLSTNSSCSCSRCRKCSCSSCCRRRSCSEATLILSGNEEDDRLSARMGQSPPADHLAPLELQPPHHHHPHHQLPPKSTPSKSSSCSRERQRIDRQKASTEATVPRAKPAQETSSPAKEAKVHRDAGSSPVGDQNPLDLRVILGDRRKRELLQQWLIDQMSINVARLVGQKASVRQRHWPAEGRHQGDLHAPTRHGGPDDHTMSGSVMGEEEEEMSDLDGTSMSVEEQDDRGEVEEEETETETVGTNSYNSWRASPSSGQQRAQRRPSRKRRSLGESQRQAKESPQNRSAGRVKGADSSLVKNIQGRPANYKKPPGRPTEVARLQKQSSGDVWRKPSHFQQAKPGPQGFSTPPLPPQEEEQNFLPKNTKKKANGKRNKTTKRTGRKGVGAPERDAKNINAEDGGYGDSNCTQPVSQRAITNMQPRWDEGQAEKGPLFRRLGHKLQPPAETTNGSGQSDTANHGYAFERVLELSPYDDIVKSYLNPPDRRVKSVALKNHCYVSVQGPFKQNSGGDTAVIGQSYNNFRTKEVYRILVASSTNERIEKCLNYLKETFPHSCLKATSRMF